MPSSWSETTVKRIDEKMKARQSNQKNKLKHLVNDLSRLCERLNRNAIIAVAQQLKSTKPYINTLL